MVPYESVTDIVHVMLLGKIYGCIRTPEIKLTLSGLNILHLHIVLGSQAIKFASENL